MAEAEVDGASGARERSRALTRGETRERIAARADILRANLYALLAR